MRRKEREVTERTDLEVILKSCLVCRVAVNDGDGIYIIPVNFGYAWAGDSLEIYFHGAKEGKKAGLLAQPIPAAFEMDCEHAMKEGDTACAYGFRYASIIGKGMASVVEDQDEQIRILECLMRHQTGKDFVIDAAMAATVNVYKIVSADFTGKRCR